MERVEALNADRKLLENRNTKLINMIKMMEEETNRIKINLRGETEFFSNSFCLIMKVTIRHV